MFEGGDKTEFKINLNRWLAIKGIFVLLLMLGAFFIGATSTVPTAYKKGYIDGVNHTLADVREKLAQADVDFNWQDLGDGKYLLEIKVAGQLYAQLYPEVDLFVEHYRNGELLSVSRGAGTLTTIGKDWIEQQLAASDGTQEALYLSDSNNDTAPDIAWTILPNEIAANGLDRQTGAYTSTGNGAWNVSVTKAVTGTQSTQLWGIHWIATDESDNNLLAADSTPAQKNCVDGDTLKETWQITVS